MHLKKVVTFIPDQYFSRLEIKVGREEGKLKLLLECYTDDIIESRVQLGRRGKER